MMSLTPMQSRALDIVRRHCSAGLAPSMTEIRTELGLASNSGVKRLLDGLAERGHIRRLPHRARAIEVVGEIDNLHRRPTEELTAMRDRIDAILRGRGH